MSWYDSGMKTFNYVVCALLIGLVLVPMSMPSFVQAEDTPPLTLPYDETSSSTFAQVVVDDVSRPVGAIDCFQYYNFGSVQVDIEPSVQSTVPGTPITFSGDITNNNPYPVIDGTVMVKIFKIQVKTKTSHMATDSPSSINTLRLSI